MATSEPKSADQKKHPDSGVRTQPPKPRDQETPQERAEREAEERRRHGEFMKL